MEMYMEKFRGVQRRCLVILKDAKAFHLRSALIIPGRISILPDKKS